MSAVIKFTPKGFNPNLFTPGPRHLHKQAHKIPVGKAFRNLASDDPGSFEDQRHEVLHLKLHGQLVSKRMILLKLFEAWKLAYDIDADAKHKLSFHYILTFSWYCMFKIR